MNRTFPGGKAAPAPIRTVPAALRCLLAAVIAVSLCAPALAGGGKAYAASTVNVYDTGRETYDGYLTNYFKVLDGTCAWCVQPNASTPAGNFTYREIRGADDRGSAVICASLIMAAYAIGADDPTFGRNVDVSAVAGPYSRQIWSAIDMHNADDSHYVRLHVMLSYVLNKIYGNGYNDPFGPAYNPSEWAEQSEALYSLACNVVDGNPTGGVSAEQCRAFQAAARAATAGITDGGSNQDIMWLVSAPQGGWIELAKSSANTEITDGNPCYSLEGAVYGVFSDEGCADKVTEMRTDGSGHAKSGLLAPGRWWVKETDAPAGYAPDTKPYPVSVSPGKTSKVNGGSVTDRPLNDPADMLLGKVDADTMKNAPEGMASLSCAEFTAQFYGGLYDTAEQAQASGGPLRTWVMRTDEDGYASLLLGEDSFATRDGRELPYKVSGDGFFHSSTGMITLPLGTLVIWESKAPEGYNLDDGRHGAPPKYVQRITEEGIEGDEVSSYNSPVVPDSVKRGDYRLLKEVPTTNDPEDQELTRLPVEGIQFQIINDGGNPVLSPDTLEDVPCGGVVTTLTTDANGLADTADHAPDGWTGALAYGSYTVHEVIPEAVAARFLAEHGITLVPVADWKVAVREEAQHDPVQIVANHIPQTPLTIVKKDAESGKTVPLECSFRIYDQDGRLVTYDDRYAESTLDTWHTGPDGKVTLPMKLDEGSYRCVEFEAPEGYAINPEGVSFEVRGYNTWDDPIVIEYRDSPIKGEVVIEKSDAATGDPVPEAAYRVEAAEDILTGDGTVHFRKGDVVADVSTGEDGTARADGLYLGRYLVFETKSPEGWALDTAEHLVSIESMGQDVPVVTMHAGMADEPTTARILKTDSETGLPLAGATFRIWQDGADPVPSYDAEGFFAAVEAALKQADPSVTRVSFSDREKAFEQIKSGAEGERVDVSANVYGAKNRTIACSAALRGDRSIDASLDGSPGFSVPPHVSTDPDAFDETRSTGEDGMIELGHLAHGAYHLAEISAPEGYYMADGNDRAGDFSVDDQGLIDGKPIAEFAFENSTTRLDVSKADATTGEEVPGAALELADEEGNVVDSWVSGEAPHRIAGLKPGRYVLTETLPPAIYDAADPVEIVLEDSGAVQKAVMKDEPIRIFGKIDKRQTIAGEGNAFDYTVDYRSLSTTWADELTVTDPLDCVAAGLARLTSIETPVCFKDWDGRLNVWYQTSLNDKADASDADAYNACDSNPANPNNPENERMCDFTGWKLWREGVPALSSATLSVEDLGLAEGEYVTAVRFEHGRVEPGFATRGAGEVWERDDLKATNDSIGASESYVHASTFEEDAKAMMYAPAVLHMSVTSDAYALESAELWNGAEMRVWRNKGAVPELLYDDDSDRVVQQTYPELTKTTVTEQAPKARFFDKTGDWLLEHWPALVAGAAAVILGCALIALGGRKAKGSGSESPAPEDHGSVV